MVTCQNYLTFYLFIYLFIYLFCCTGCYLWQAGSLVVACELLVAACMWDLVPRSGIEPGPPALGTQSLPRDHQGSPLTFILKAHLESSL